MRRAHDEFRDQKCAIARAAGLDPNLIPEDDFVVEGDTIRYRYVLLDDEGNRRAEGNSILRTDWMTAKVGGSAQT